jgi:uncharacterized protein (DUF2235 family)
MSKTIVFCADGTWNNPGNADQKSDGCEPQLTNVCKLFGWLSGELDGSWGRKEMEKSLKAADGSVVQMGKYIHGVGDAQGVVDRVAGGAFGVGVTARIARGYTYLSRNYVAGDNIVIAGFSRGAYTARSLAGLVLGEGLLKPELATNVGDKYDNAVAAWFRFRHARDSTLQKWIDGAAEFEVINEVFGRSEKLTDDSFVPVDGLRCVAVWDTVGALGIPAFDLTGARVDLYQFCDTKLNPKVHLGLHAVSLDERRDSFIPTLWNDAPNVTQALFAGGHCDVGGGYAEHGLSDVSLMWFVERLKQTDVGLKFDLHPPTDVFPDPLACCHKEWVNAPWPTLGVHPRKFPQTVVANDSVRLRLNDTNPEKMHPQVPPAVQYKPVNLPGTAQ